VISISRTSRTSTTQYTTLRTSSYLASFRATEAFSTGKTWRVSLTLTASGLIAGEISMKLRIDDDIEVYVRPTSLQLSLIVFTSFSGPSRQYFVTGLVRCEQE